MYLEVKTPSFDQATIVVETALRCGLEPLKLKRHCSGENGNIVFAVFFRGNQKKLSLCQTAIAEEKYFTPDQFSFRNAANMGTFLT